MDRKQKLFSKLNLWKKLKTSKMLFLVFSFQSQWKHEYDLMNLSYLMS